MTETIQAKRDLAITRTLNDLNRITNRVRKHLTRDEIRGNTGLHQFYGDLIELRANLLHTVEG